MTLEEAIEILELVNTWNKPYWVTESREAAQLGIEALDHILRERLANPGTAHTILKGEIKD